ncbi:Protein NDRG2 [Cricetulus griseus]|uniref:Protein NDRG2 n=1 Tax=Cricetulus griseus TaxID=10029 RepID=G3IJ53_CRIGR|nr:Protein NDRG2 [Cricetulus griseus]ERE89559.1 protein NDRG2-like isoform 2 [Cricetulus griseus]
MAELQEVQITEEKPLLPGQTPETAKEAELAARILLDQGQTHSVETPYGSVTFTVYGTPKPKRPAIFTYHDVGLNYKSCFQPLFQFGDMQEIIQNFVRVHVDAPGMEEGAPVFPLGYQYPSLDQLADMIPCILQYLNFSTIIGVGVGAGAYILSRYALTHPDTVEGLVLINIDPNAKGWMDWAAHKLTGLTSSIPEMILGHLFSQEELSGNSELIQKYRNIITHAPNLENIELYWNSYNKCPVMLVVGDQAPHEDAVPGKLTEAFKYFLQGMGYMASSCMTRLSRSRTASLTSAASIDGSRSRSRTLSQSSESGTLPSGPPGHTMEVSC